MPPSPEAADQLTGVLQTLGAKRIEAILVSTLHRHGALGTKPIVERTGLRQPEVSVGMQALRDRGWVEAEAIPRKGKGRPMHKYRLVVPAKEIRRHYESAGRAAIEAYQAAIEVLRKELV